MGWGKEGASTFLCIHIIAVGLLLLNLKVEWNFSVFFNKIFYRFLPACSSFLNFARPYLANLIDLHQST